MRQELTNVSFTAAMHLSVAEVNEQGQQSMAAVLIAHLPLLVKNFVATWEFEHWGRKAPSSLASLSGIFVCCFIAQRKPLKYREKGGWGF